jgi:hypothetical protein
MCLKNEIQISNMKNKMYDWNLWNTKICVYIYKYILYFPTMQCGKPFFSNTRQNGEWTETSTRQNEIELAMVGEWHFF